MFGTCKNKNSPLKVFIMLKYLDKCCSAVIDIKHMLEAGWKE